MRQKSKKDRASYWKLHSRAFRGAPSLSMEFKDTAPTKAYRVYNLPPLPGLKPAVQMRVCEPSFLLPDPSKFEGQFFLKPDL